MWVHVQRLGRPETAPPRALGWQLGAVLLLLALLVPASSGPHWDASLAPQGVAVDWFYQFIHPLMYATSPSALWIMVIGFSLALLAIPLLPEARKPIVAVVDPRNCNGCQRCVADCPYNAIEMKDMKASVIAARCAACGICAGACPSSTPFRSIRELVSGIELPDLSIHDLRRKVRNALDAGKEEILFHCENQPRQEGIALRCLAMLPPAFVDWALRNGATRVRAAGCEDCAYRLGMALSDERFARTREPRLRATVRAERTDHEYTFTQR
jgi:ferredoxin